MKSSFALSSNTAYTVHFASPKSPKLINPSTPENVLTIEKFLKLNVYFESNLLLM